MDQAAVWGCKVRIWAANISVISGFQPRCGSEWPGQHYVVAVSPECNNAEGEEAEGTHFPSCLLLAEQSNQEAQLIVFRLIRNLEEDLIRLLLRCRRKIS